MPASKFKGELTLEAPEPMPEAVITRSSGVDLTPYTNILRASMAEADDDGMGVVMGTTIPAEAESTAISRFRSAAQELNTGVKFGSVKHTDDGASDFGLTADKIRLLVQTKPKATRKPKGTTKKAGK